MTLRETPGRDAQRVHEQVDELLDREDGIIVLFDGQRAVSYAAGFALSGSQLELLAVDIERLVRAETGMDAPTSRRHEREKNERVGPGATQRRGSRRCVHRSRVADKRSQSDRPRDHPGGSDRGGTGRVLRMANQVAAPNAG